MPSYRNVGIQSVEFAGVRIKSGEIYPSFVCYQNGSLPLGLVRESDHPSWNPILYSVKLVNGGVVKIPEKDSYGVALTRYLVHLHVVAGEPKIAYNSEEIEHKLFGYAGMTWNTRVYERVLDKIIVHGDSIIFVTVEAI